MMREISLYERVELDDNHVIHKLFKGLLLDYTKFLKGVDKKHTEATKRRWAYTLRKFTDAEILSTLIDRLPLAYPNQTPPTAGGFYKLCEANRFDLQPKRNRHDINEDEKSDPEVGRKALGSILTGLRGSMRVSDPIDDEALQARKAVLLKQAESLMEDENE